MQPSEIPLRAPAEITRIGYVSAAFNRLLTRLADCCFPCRHNRTSLPFNDRQRCLDCGASRLYFFDSDFAHGFAGIQSGPWHKDEPFPIQSAKRIARRQVNLNGIALRPLDGRSAILNPGAENPIFQPRTTTVVERIEASTADIYSRHEQAVQA